MQRHYVMVRAAVVKLWIWFNAVSSFLASGEQSQVVQPWCFAKAMLAFVPAWYCWLATVFSLDKKVQGWGYVELKQGSNVQLLIAGCDDPPLLPRGPLYDPPPPLPNTPNMTHWGLMTGLPALCMNQGVSCILFYSSSHPLWTVGSFRHSWHTLGFLRYGETLLFFSNHKDDRLLVGGQMVPVKSISQY